MIYHGFRIRRKSTKSQQIQVNYSLIREASDQKILDLWGQQIIQGLPQKQNIYMATKMDFFSNSTAESEVISYLPLHSGFTSIRLKKQNIQNCLVVSTPLKNKLLKWGIISQNIHGEN